MKVEKEKIKQEKIKELSKFITLKRHYGISTEEILQLICNLEGLKLKRNKRSFNIKFR